MEWLTGSAQQSYAALVRAADGLVIGLDFDGTLAPIVDDPDAAHIHPEAPDLLVRLSNLVRGIAVVTGRPARQVLALGGLDEVGQRLDAEGRELIVLGQYGNERWTSSDRRVISPPPPRGLSSLLAELPGILADAGAADAWVEEKGLAVAVHTRRMEQPQAAYDALLPALGAAAERHGLTLEPGRRVIEIRAAGMDKGHAVRALAAELGATAFAFVGDDLGDVEAFEAVRDMTGIPTLLVCSGSDEVARLRELADVIVPGPGGVMALLSNLAGDIDTARL